MMFIVAPVHTTGVNWDGVLANVGSLTVILGVLFGLLSRMLRGQLRDAVEKQVAPLLAEIKIDLQAIKSEIDQHSTAIARLEGFEQGRQMYQKTLDQSRRQANDVAGDP
jgi:hypothetical protein